jgi:hypothetical protein
MISVQVSLQPTVTVEEVMGPIRQVVREGLEQIPSLVRDLIAGRYPVC